MSPRTDTSLWHPFADMAALRDREFVLSRGEGVWLFDEAGKRYLDGSASLWYCNIGHGRTEIADAVAEQMKRLETWSIFGNYATPPALELADALAERSSLDGAKIFLTSGGVFPPSPGYIERTAGICRDAGVLFVCDSVICGFGRLGTWFGYERFGIEPDLVTFAKGVTSGYLPLGGVVVSGQVAEPFWSEPGRITIRHGQTYVGHARVCAAALANIEILAREDIVALGEG